jgi:hypothetical protein
MVTVALWLVAASLVAISFESLGAAALLFVLAALLLRFA